MTTEWTKEDMDEAERLYMRERHRRYQIRGVLNELMTFAVERALQAKDAEIARLKVRLKEYHGEVDGVDASHDDSRDGVTGIVAWVKSNKARLKKTKAGIFDTGFRCVSDGGETFYLDPEELEAIQDERDALRAELARLKPSGQVEEDDAYVRSTLATADGDMGYDAGSHDALFRLASQAQAALVLAEARNAFVEYVTKHAGHEEHCRGWRRPVNDKSAPAWKRRGEWMDVTACTCGPGELLRRAATAISIVRKP